MCWRLLLLGVNLLPSVSPDSLARDRAILLELFGQITKLAEFYRRLGWDAAPYEDEARRVHLRLLVVQMRLEEFDYD